MGFLKRWHGGFAQLREKLLAVSGRLDSFHCCRERSALLLNELRESLERRGQESGWGAAAKLVRQLDLRQNEWLRLHSSCIPEDWDRRETDDSLRADRRLREFRFLCVPSASCVIG
jgi:hypothetical protein